MRRWLLIITVVFCLSAGTTLIGARLWRREKEHQIVTPEACQFYEMISLDDYFYSLCDCNEQWLSSGGTHLIIAKCIFLHQDNLED